MNEEKYYRLIVDLWRLFRQVIQEKNRKGAISWNLFESRAVLFVEQHGNSRLAKDLAIAILDELERRETQ